jgi:Ca2+-binding EF-hand superfamily protein
MENNQTEHLPDGGKMISSIEWLYNLMFEKRGRITFEDFKQCKDNYMQELKHAYEAEQNNCRGIFKYESFEHYYRENYGK